MGEEDNSTSTLISQQKLIEILLILKILQQLSSICPKKSEKNMKKNIANQSLFKVVTRENIGRIGYGKFYNKFCYMIEPLIAIPNFNII